MSGADKTAKRPYHAPRRAAAAARTREAVLTAAKRNFETRGWPGTTMRVIGAEAGVSHKTVEALFGTKAALLQAVVDFSIRGDVRAVPIGRREAVSRMEAAPDAVTMLDLHAAQVTAISERSAGIAWVVEHAAPSEAAVAQLWRRMTDNRHTGVRWATKTLLEKPDADPTLDSSDVGETFWVALEWGTYRTLTDHRGLTRDDFQRWLRRYYRRMLGR
jgi:AcrR family transcriptional regulator